MNVRLCLLILVSFSGPAFAYGPLGHEIVGEIADRRIAGTSTAAKLYPLLGRLTLARAANIPDEIKAWDSKGAEDLSAYPHYPRWPQLEVQLREFWKANRPGPAANNLAPSHHWFHYTDVPVLANEMYAQGKRGRGNWDIVHTIPFCVAVLRGEVPEANARKITRPVAVVLLAHLVGDIHQPLHVGAEYFTAAGAPVNPDLEAGALGDEGGNSLSFRENATPERPQHYYHSFHGYWDLDLPRNLVIRTPDELPKTQRAGVYTAPKEKLIEEMAVAEPAGWRTAGDPKTWAEQWANEILPTAREAHARVRFAHVHEAEEEGRAVAKGEAIENGSGYREWGTGVVRQELHKAGWRLADLLEKSL